MESLGETIAKNTIFIYMSKAGHKQEFQNALPAFE